MFKYNQAFSSFSVNDLQKAKTFYTETLGLQVNEQKEGLDVKANGSAIFLYAKPYHVPATFTVLNFLVADIEKTVDQLISRGVTFEHYTGHIKTDEKGIFRDTEGPFIAWFSDPAGNIISVIQNHK